MKPIEFRVDYDDDIIKFFTKCNEALADADAKLKFVFDDNEHEGYELIALNDSREHGDVQHAEPEIVKGHSRTYLGKRIKALSGQHEGLYGTVLQDDGMFIIVKFENPLYESPWVVDLHYDKLEIVE